MQLEVGVLGRVDYQRALALQEALVARRLAGGPDTILLLEHPRSIRWGAGAIPAISAAPYQPVFRLSARSGAVR